MRPHHLLLLALLQGCTLLTEIFTDNGKRCGDGVRLQEVEACDDGNQSDEDGCKSDCTLNVCGDTFILQGSEECDDGNLITGDGCSALCEAEGCGNGRLDAGEGCDDGNAVDADTCPSTCELAFCGDSFLLPEQEQCDDGNNLSGDGCDVACQIEACGNGTTDAGEACDDGNLIDSDECTNDCRFPSCSDGIQQGAEQCDDGNQLDGDGCSSLCQSEICGNGRVDFGEQCDDGNQSDTDACTNLCTDAVCGDSLAQLGVEECDDGNATDGDGCSALCLAEICGNGRVDFGEQCDDTNQVNSDACTNECLNAICGDNITQTTTEECDDGNTTTGDGCSSLCQLEVCGNGRADFGEQCDDANQSNTDACTSTCISAVCGDGFTRVGVEECDDANLLNGDGCSAICQSELCGNGRVDFGEQCDDSNQINSDACTNLCQNAVCNDGFIRAGVEECDDTNNLSGDGCSSLCQLEVCGNNRLDFGEQCDDGNDNTNDACPSGPTGGCQSARCGDGFPRPGFEQCDDGNATNTDGCTNACLSASCGDGFILDQNGNGLFDPATDESCDDNNLINGDGCSSVCQQESCGDGIIQAPETCDDQNTNNNDECLNTCRLAACGDGFVQDNVEACDDGDQSDDDGCSSTCQVEVCGDGIQQANEQCDDANVTTGDGCSSLCVIEAPCTESDVPAGAQRAIDPATGHCLARVSLVRNWLSAHNTCQSSGGYLAVPDSAEENTLIRSITNPTQSVWIGINDITVEAGTVAANFQKVTGGTIGAGFHNFGTGLPNPNGDEDCGQIPANVSTWNDLTCSFTTPQFVCEFEQSPCGDGVLQASLGEQCDDGNNITGDGCTALCVSEVDCDAISLADINARAIDPETGHCLLGVNQPLTWPNAQDACEGIGGYLVVIESTQENDLARSMIQLSSQAWIGFNDRVSEAANIGANFQKVTGGTIGAGFQRFSPGEPNNSGDEDCVGFRDGSSQWNDSDCELDLFRFVCEVELTQCGDGATQPAFGENCDDGNSINGDTCDNDCTFPCGPAISPDEEILGAAFDAGSGRCYLRFGQELSWQDAELACEQNSGYLAVIESATENTIISGLASGAQTWIGVTDLAQESDDAAGFRRVTGGTIGAGFHNFDLGEPNNVLDEDCAKMRENGKWNDSQCESALEFATFVCEFNANPCGDGVKQANEGCDDKNLINGDGCSSTCTIEPTFDCTSLNPSVGVPSQCSSCGDGILQLDEECDDDNTADDDGCSSDCLIELCGDGVINNGAETCDDGDQSNNDGCDSNCQTETCGNGVTQAHLGESCDDGNTTTGDGCTSQCKIEAPCAASDFPLQTTRAVDPASGHCLVALTQQDKDWFEAELTCEMLGGYLVVIESSGENTLARSITNSAQAAWIGLSDASTEAGTVAANFQKINGGIIGAGFRNFAPGEPSASTADSDCVELIASSSQWGDLPCSQPHTQFVCEVEPEHCGDNVRQSSIGEECDDGNNINDASCNSDCSLVCGPSILGATDARLDSSTGSCYVHVARELSWQDAESACEAKGGYLAVIESTQELAVIEPLSFTSERTWIGLTDLAQEANAVASNFRRVTGGTIGAGFHRFGAGEPNNSGDEDCAELREIDEWNDGDCSFAANFLCEFEPNPCGDGVLQTSLGEQCDDGNLINGDRCSSACTIEPNSDCASQSPSNGFSSICNALLCGNGIRQSGEECDDGNLNNNDGCSAFCKQEVICNAATYPLSSARVRDPQSGHCLLRFSQSRTWQDAQSLCEGSGGYLAVIESSNENALVDSIANDTQSAWIGFHDQDVEANSTGANFQKITGGTIGAGFINFNTGEPNNAGGNEDCVELQPNNTKWNDANCANTFPQFICEIELNACGDGVLQPGEECEGGDRDDNDGCSSTCDIEVCGDGITQTNEECDDDNTTTGDGCTAQCKIEAPCAASDFPSSSARAIDPASGNCVYRVSSTKSWNNAELACESDGGYLAVIDSSAENTLARGLSTLAQIAWIGFTDQFLEANSNAAAFLRVNGGLVGAGFTNFNTGEPNNSGNNEDCVGFRSNASNWNDFGCASLISQYICEAEANSCGDGVLQLNRFETCDDGNNDDDDGCNSICQIEHGFVCSSQTPALGIPSDCE